MIYLDNSATTQVDPRVIEKMLPVFLEDYGNSSSVDHEYGSRANSLIEESKINIAKLVGCNPNRIVFTSGSSESINTILLGYQSFKKRKINILTSHLEHKVVLEVCDYLRELNLANVYFSEVSEDGQLDFDSVVNSIKIKKIDILVCMSANNEIGNLYPVSKLSIIANELGVDFFMDATQSVGKVPISFDEMGLSYLTLSAHKMYGPKGIGAIVLKDKNTLNPLIRGGGQQYNLRSGTLNVPGIVGLGEACRLRMLEMTKDENYIVELKTAMLDRLKKSNFEIIVVGSEPKISGVLPISFPGIPNKAIVNRIRHEVAISTGAACTSGAQGPSHVLIAMNLPVRIIDGFLRISIGKFNTIEEIIRASELVTNAIGDIKKIL